MRDLLALVEGVPSTVLYVALAVGAALENLVPAVPADTFVALGGLLAGTGELRATTVALWTWGANVAGALGVYAVSRRHGAAFFEHGWGRFVLRPHQMERVARFYATWGTPALFLSRFVPGLRAAAPVFAGVTNQPWVRTAVPIGVASGIWYGGLVWLGVTAGHNLDRLGRILAGVNRALGALGVVAALGLALWWYRSRRAPHG